MKHQKIQIKTLTTAAQCDDAIRAIENDYRNIEGANDSEKLKRWISGKQTYLLKGALDKINSLGNKSDKITNRNHRRP